MKDKISLITNTGLQFVNFDFEINSNDEVIKGLKFHEWFDTKDYNIKLELAEYLPLQDVWTTKQSLLREGYIDENGKLSENINTSLLKILSLGEDCFVINDIEDSLEQLKGKWMPIPFFEKEYNDGFLFNGLNWARLQIRIKEKINSTYVCTGVIVFDTSTAGPEQNLRPVFNDFDVSKEFALCSNEEMLLDFFSEAKGCSWVEEYVKKLYDAENRQNFPSLKYVGLYLYFIKYLAVKSVLPEVILFKDDYADASDVDLSIDIGNSETCVLLFDKTENKDAFSAVKKLSLVDISDPFIKHTGSFDMRIAFHNADFGDIKPLDDQFQWPSILRCGSEASRLIYQSTNKDYEGGNKLTHHSSPKRYLWDDEISKRQWEFITTNESLPIKSVYMSGISEQLNSDGSLCNDLDFGMEALYSRKSLMTFVFIEVLLHAYRQINSFEFRKSHGNFSKTRKIGKIIITCPTAMPRKEQLELRRSAETASIILNKYYGRPGKVSIIPSVKDLSLDYTNIENKNEWNYDEATCCQMVFMYAEVAKRYLNNCSEYFDLYGRKRDDLAGYDRKALTVGSIDIGAGTTDLMICTYKYEDANKAELTPIPLFWESFYYAGHDLVKEIIKQVIIESDYKGAADEKFLGLISKKLSVLKTPNPNALINDFFGVDTNRINYEGRKMRSEFNVQISTPMAYYILDLVRRNVKNQTITFDDVFKQNRPKKELLDYFRNHFGFGFDDLVLEYNLETVETIIERVFEPLLKTLSTLLYAYGCDFVLIAGKPTGLKKVEDLFYKFYPVSPDRIVSLNKYRVGKWYPFSEGNGYFEDKKSIVAVGAMIGYLGSTLDQLGNFKLRMDYMKYKMPPTTKYFGLYEGATKNIHSPFISMENNRDVIELNGLPVYIGAKQLDFRTYPSQLMYVIDFNDDEIKKRIEESGNYTDLNEAIERYKTRIKNDMPIKFKITRDSKKDREELVVDSILTKSNDDLSPKIFKFKFQTLDMQDESWLDSGAFLLSIKNL